MQSESLFGEKNYIYELKQKKKTFLGVTLGVMVLLWSIAKYSQEAQDRRPLSP